MAHCSCSGSQLKNANSDKNQEFVMTEMKITPYHQDGSLVTEPMTELNTQQKGRDERSVDSDVKEEKDEEVVRKQREVGPNLGEKSSHERALSISKSFV
jgi:hypothetical protein